MNTTIWQRPQWASFYFHILVVAVPLLGGTVAAWLLWSVVFGPWLAALIVASVDLLCLAGLVLHLYRVPSPFQALRHALPFVSFVPLGWELFHLALPNVGPWAAVVAAVGLTGWAVWLDFASLQTLTGLFDPASVASQQTTDAAQLLTSLGNAAKEANTRIDAFAFGWVEQRQPTMLPAPQEIYPRPQGTPQVTHVLAGPQTASPQAHTAGPQGSDPLWPAKVAVWQARQGDKKTSWSELAVVNDRSPATLRGWAAQVDAAQTTKEVA